MKLGRKTLMYSLILGVLVAVLLLVHMVILLPALYVDYQESNNRETVKAVHMAALENKEQGKKKLKGQSGTVISVHIPKDKDVITFVSPFASGTVRIKEERINAVVSRYKRYLLEAGKDEKLAEQLREKIKWNKKTEKLTIKDPELKKDLKMFEAYVSRMQAQMAEGTGLEADIQWTTYESTDGDIAYQQIGDNTVMLEMGVMDISQKEEYKTYVVCSVRKDGIYITAASKMIPRINDILPVILQNLPMIIAVLFVIVLAGSLLFSRRLVEPVVRIQQYTAAAKEGTESILLPPAVKGGDELAELADNVRDLYETKQRQYQRLSEISQRKEVFLRASSHRLKTPIAATLLLVEGMIQRVGRYADYETYLPKVKEQLQSMQRMIEDVLYMNKAEQDPMPVMIPVRKLIDGMVEKTAPQRRERRLSVEVTGEAVWKTDEDMLEHILDNLIGNAVQYTEEGGRIRITVFPEGFRIENEPAHIETELLSMVKEPFVSGNTEGDAHGLGLYLTDFYAGLLGMECRIENTEQGVAVVLEYRREEAGYAGV
ncbi:sensor histidine kinase [Suipraeoptans intestinalis]|uniref:sensor histidine kinase n=1 Tax=Suipraeoptans intestinalis TaxID=2606628 RepID=UPI0023F1F9CD|nr:HAMP domain-containing sensor histidine kinase [Suipraeoptans intestinalis]MDD7769354.1 HAMP domain-containing sensor histidine kinase [Suipraeoptans intestinalis]